MPLGDTFWLIAVVGGPILLGALIAYGVIRNRKVTRREKAAGEAGARRIYHKDQKTG